MRSKNKASGYHAVYISVAVSVVILTAGIYFANDLSLKIIISGLLWPLVRLMFFIGIGLVAGQVIEASGWTKILGDLASPLFRFGNLGHMCSAAFTTAFFSGVAANAMLLDFYKDEKISRRQLYLTNLINQLPAYFLHLPTTFFIVVPLTGRAGILYFSITFAATLLRTSGFLIYGKLRLSQETYSQTGEGQEFSDKDKKKPKGIWEGVRSKFPKRFAGVATYVIPIYIFVFFLNAMGIFSLARNWVATYVVTTFIPIEALSVIILSFVAEFTSGFAAAGALLETGVLTIKQTALCLWLSEILYAFPYTHCALVAEIYGNICAKNGNIAASDGAGISGVKSCHCHNCLLLSGMRTKKIEN